MAVTRCLAVDLGASGGKCFAGLFSGGGFEMREVHRFEHESVAFYLPDAAGRPVERRVWDDTLIYAQILAGLRACRREIGDRLDAVGLDTWGADGHVIGPDGDLLGKMYAYRDHRLDGMIEQVKARIGPERLYALTGIHFQPFNVSNQILWLVQNRPALLQPGCRYAPIPSLFYYYLGGALRVDSTWASVTQLMDAGAREWSPDILEALGIPPGFLPPIVPPGTCVGVLQDGVARAAGLNAARLIAVGGHDTASAYAAAPAADPGGALIVSSGTWSLVGRLVPNPITTPDAMTRNLSNEGGIGHTRLLRNCMGGWLVQELRREWREADGRETPWPDLYRAAREAPAFAALVDPDDPALYNPASMEQALKAACQNAGQRAPASRGGLVRMAYESLALKYRWINEALAEVCGRRATVAHIVGGGSRNELLNQFAANALGVPVLAGPVEATAVGNLMVQALGLGLLPSLADAIPLIRRAFPIREFRPADTDAWDRVYARFLDLGFGR